MMGERTGCYGVIVDWKAQEPTLMESEGPATSHERARSLMERFAANPNVLRVAMVRLVYESGSQLLMLDMERLHNVKPD